MAYAIHQKCPSCEQEMKYGENIVGTRGQKPGDILICAKCAGVFILDKAMLLHAATLKDLAGMPSKIVMVIAEAQHVILAQRAGRN
jgi:hypothetical protein